MTSAEAQNWIAGLEQVTGYRWSHRVDHRARDEFKLIVSGYELHLWSNGRWAIYSVDSGDGMLNPGARPFSDALAQLRQELHRRLST